VAIVLYLFGVPSPVLFGTLWAVLRFVPYVGTLVAVSMPAVLAFAVLPGLAWPLVAILTTAAIDIAFAYVVEPIVIGRRCGVTPVAVLISAIVWTWLWGPLGLILATPIAVSLQVLGETVPSLGFLEVILGFLTLTGSLMAAGKLQELRWIPQRPVTYKG
jgi:predicted PurR-regulated permease PerM